MPRHKFKQAIEEIVGSVTPLPDYDLKLVAGEAGPLLVMSRREEQGAKTA